MTNLNPYAPPCYNGVNDQSPAGYHDEDYAYIFQFTALVATVQTKLLLTDVDADFVWRAVSIPPGVVTGSDMALRFSDGQSYFISDQMISAVLFQVDASAPFPLAPGEIIVPAGAQIRIDLQMAANTSVEIQFRGVKRYKR